MIDTLLTRLQRLEDLQAIQQLLIDYGQYLDAGDFSAYAGLFAEQGEVLLGPLGRAKGRIAIQELMSRALADLVGHSYHIISSPQITLAGERATTEVMWTVIKRAGDGSPVVQAIGRHRDELIREHGHWRFLKRKGFVDIPSTLPV